jgi:hypothetical protein
MVTLNDSFVEVYSGTADHLITQFSKHKTHRGKPTDLERAKRIAPFYIKYGKLFNLRADFAWGQMEHETGFLTFLGDVGPHQNNFAGIGATGGVPGNSFETEELGVIAHFAHLAWYYFSGHVNEFCSKKYDPRHFEGPYSPPELTKVVPHPRYTGDTTLGHLAGSWAVPGTTYAQAIFTYIKEIDIVFQQPDISAEKFDIIVQMGHVPRTTGFTGTAGEQAFVKEVGSAMNYMLLYAGINVRLMGADDWLKPEPNLCKIFFALHCDGSSNITADGFSCGFKPETNQRFKDSMAISYKEFTGFKRRADNYTDNMKNYYSWRDYTYKPTHVKADFYLLLEHGFLTNPKEKEWLNSHRTEIAIHHSKIIVNFLKNL